MDSQENAENAIDISDLRVRIDQLNEKIISGLKTRSRFALNKETFSKEFADGKTWIMYRLKKEQDLDSEFGRFLYYDQQPFVFPKEELESAKIQEPENKGLSPVKVDLSSKIIDLYRTTIEQLCEASEDISTYGETTKLDVENILTLNERTAAIGEQVAGYKITQEPALLKIGDSGKIREQLIYPEREKDVREKMATIAKKYEIKDIEMIKDFAQKLIEITLDSEVNFIMQKSKK